ncbi:MAG TPA: NADH:flavin oxidoreductase [Chitinophagales bacterium]|jgi:2,4-dienoyl-CoA reductase-like NADH-dependent reductase (Old Yellow Enzyme family)|nr:NADH:flavin oxidoreductase [Chitinophagales bacterium]HQO32503.1 NADH:flavin oxidoreductase [Chitinophagales bacterium]HQO89637.1 NADH:flavin oxidoreductase [Chitinophagales bacterium]
MSLQKLLSPATLNGLSLKNRIIKAATFEGMIREENITEQCIELHTTLARHDVGLTTLAYCAPEADGRLDHTHFYIRESVLPTLRQLADNVHAAGGKLSGQISHCGGFSKNKQLQRRRPVAPSLSLNTMGAMYGLLLNQPMNESLMQEVIGSYKNAAQLMKSAGFDAIEIHFGHGYLLSQFISPLTNKRNDEYGGPIHHRMRFPLRVLEGIRNVVGSEFPLLAKITMYDDLKGGITLQDSLETAKILEKNGIDAIILSAGTSSQNAMLLFHGDSILPGLLHYEKNPVLRFFMQAFKNKFFRNYPYKPLYLLEQAQQFRDTLQTNLVYIGGATEPDDLEKVMQAGFDFVQLGRPLLRDPAMVKHLLQMEKQYRNGCTHCNQCAPLMNDPDGIRCVLPAWTTPAS